MLFVRFAFSPQRILRSPLGRRDNVSGRALTGAAYTSTSDMTIESCVNFCDGQNFNYAGLEWYQECYCGNYIINGGAETTSTDCSFPCTGDANEVCGAGNRLSMYHSGRASPSPPQIVPSVGSWVSQGCYTSVFSRPHPQPAILNLVLPDQRQRRW